jgi:hypothetical protein
MPWGTLYTRKQKPWMGCVRLFVMRCVAILMRKFTRQRASSHNPSTRYFEGGEHLVGILNNVAIYLTIEKKKLEHEMFGR